MFLTQLSFAISPIMGGNLSIGKKMKNNKLSTRLSVGYNSNNNGGIQTQLINMRTMLSLNIEKHRFSLNAMNMLRNIENKPKTNELRVNFGYNYSFDILKKKNAKLK